MRLSDPQRFTIVSGVLIVLVSIGIGYGASAFYRTAMIERELAVMTEMIRTIILEEAAEENLSSDDLNNFSDPKAHAHLSHTFQSLTWLPGFSLVKVFLASQVIAWSNDKELIGRQRTQHIEAVARAFSQEQPMAFNPVLVGKGADRLIEVYVPFRLATTGPVVGVLSLYRSAEEIDAAIAQGVRLLWLMSAGGGIILYLALYRLFVLVYNQKNELSSQFEKFTADHKRILQIEKLSAMGRMVTEIAHQLNNRLVGVVNLTELAERQSDNPAKLKPLLAQVRAAGQQSHEYVQRILGFGQLDHSNKKQTDMSAVVAESIDFLHQSLPGQARIVFDRPQPITCKIDPLLVRNAVFNLVHNAVQADGKGPIEVSVQNEARDGVQGSRIAVCDRGPGIPLHVIEKLFTPFFTTRSEGTGLGLSIAQQIAVLHGGSVKAENRRDGGSCFTMWIPTGESRYATENPFSR